MKHLTVVLLILLFARVSFAQTSTPNIVLILTDDQGWTSTSVQLDPDNPLSKSDFYQTPCLDALASQGMRFSNAYSSGPVCSPTRSSIQTGKSPAQLQMADIVNGGDLENPEVRFLITYVGEPLSPPLPRTRLPLAEVTIAERIKQANPNYVAAHFAKWHMGLAGSHEVDPPLQGYDEFLMGPKVDGENPKDIDRIAGATRKMRQMLDGLDHLPPEKHPPEKWLEDINKGT